MKQKSINILGVRIDCIQKKDVLAKIYNLILNKKYNNALICTVNPSFILKACNDMGFSNILNTISKINTADGVGVQIAAEYVSLLKHNDTVLQKLYLGIKTGLMHTFGKKEFNIIHDKITGVYLTHNLLEYCASNYF